MSPLLNGEITQHIWFIINPVLQGHGPAGLSVLPAKICRSNMIPITKTIPFVVFFFFLPLHRPGHGDEELILRTEHVYEVLPAGRTDGPQRVGAAFQLRDAQVRRGVTLQPLHGLLTAGAAEL